MDTPARSSDGIPFPQFRTIFVVVAIGLGAWIAWGVADGIRARRALMDPAAPSMQRIQAVDRWAKLGREAVPELTEALKSEDVKTRELAVLALTQIGRDAEDAGPALARLLADPSHAIRATALRALSRIGHPFEQRLPEVVALLSDPDRTVRNDAAEILDVIDSPKPEARKHAVTLLGRVGEGDPQAIAAVHRAAADADDQVRGSAYGILLFWNELTLDEAVAGLRDANPKIASDVAESVDRLGEDAEILIPDLIRLLDRDDTKFSAGPRTGSRIGHPSRRTTAGDRAAARTGARRAREDRCRKSRACSARFAVPG